MDSAFDEVLASYIAGASLSLVVAINVRRCRKGYGLKLARCHGNREAVDSASVPMAARSVLIAKEFDLH